MEILLNRFRVKECPNLKQDLIERKLTKGIVEYVFVATAPEWDRKRVITHYTRNYLKPMHELLIGNEDYEGGNIVLFSYSNPCDKVWDSKKRDLVPGFFNYFGVLFNKINSIDSLPDNLVFRHGNCRLEVINYTKG